MRVVVPPEIRFHRHYEINEQGCWVWKSTHAGTKSRRPTFGSGTRSSDSKVYAHRWSYSQFVGPIPAGMEIDHLCRNGSCVNPDHLEPVTQAENNRRNRLKVCRKGLHDLTDPDNVRWDNQGRRRGCKPCKLENEKLYEDRRVRE